MQDIENRRDEKLPTNTLMTAGEIAIHLIKNCDSLKYFNAYMFGSTLKGIGHDIDLLIIGPAGDALSVLKKEIAIAGSELPLDVLYMIPAEAKETDFVIQEGCIELSILATLETGVLKS